MSPLSTHAFFGMLPIFIRRIIYKFSNVYPFDYIAFAVIGKVGIRKIGLTTPVG